MVTVRVNWETLRRRREWVDDMTGERDVSSALYIPFFSKDFS